MIAATTAIVDLPHGTDPADFDRDTVWNLIRSQTQLAGVPLAGL